MSKRIVPALLLLLTAGCGAGEVPRIAAVLPLSGEYEIYGRPIRQGIELAVAELAERGDLATPLELTVVDTESDPERAAALLSEEFSAGAFAAIGGVTTAEALAMVPVADRFNRVLMSPSASNPQLTGISRNFYRVFPSDALEGTTMANFVASEMQIETAVVVAKEETYALGVREVFAAELERNGGRVLEVIEYPAGAADFSGLLDRVVALGPQAVYLSAFADDIGAMIAELRRRGYAGALVTTSAFSSPAAIEQLGEAAERVLLTQAVFDAASEDPGIRSFVESFREKHGYAPGIYAAHGYDAVMSLARALESGRPAASEFWQNVRGIRDFSGVTGTIQFDEQGDVQKFPRVYAVVNGGLVDYKAYLAEERQKRLAEIRRLEAEMKRRLAESGG